MWTRNGSRSIVALIGVAALGFGTGARAQSTQVETFTASGVVQCTLPGTPSPSGVNFATQASVMSVDFTPGSVVFNGTPVDFDGTEPQFLASAIDGPLVVPVSSGPAITTVIGTGTVLGPGGTTPPRRRCRDRHRVRGRRLRYPAAAIRTRSQAR
jgi:hypothetical protein